MENPEEILHSLEEFAKMKPKDIPRELEEYLKFVAKTGDPVYQWSAVKSLFREKFVNVITEFYESCTSMEIPLCPNVEMFNYDLMKNFILEKIDTFASAPFTLQRISELLTSPRKEYTRIDKYMRALEKNILVVSTMEPGGRRTENGEGIMNGVESDHDIVPEPGNEINVEEMDESPYIQTTNHVTERISFESPKNSTHIEIESSVGFSSEKISSVASTSSQEIVCVQYVSIEPVTDNTENLIEDVKEGDVSVTITAVNIKGTSQVKDQIIEPASEPLETILTEHITEVSSEALTENITKPEPEPEPEPDVNMEPVESTDDALKIENTDTLTHSISEATPSTTVSDKISEETDHVSSGSDAIPESRDTGSVSPENSVTSSDNSPCESSSESNTSVDVPLDTSSTDDSKKESLEDQTGNKEADDMDNESDAVDSTTKASGDNIESAVLPQIGDETNKIEISMEVPLESNATGIEDIPQVQSTDKDNTDESASKSVTVADQSSEAEDIHAISEEPKSENVEPVQTKVDEVSSPSEEKETPMEVDVEPEYTSDISSREKPTTEEPASSEPPEKP